MRYFFYLQTSCALLFSLTTIRNNQITMTTSTALKAPFTYFGGKSKVAPIVWNLLDDPDHYLEPFGGSLAILLGRDKDSYKGKTETVNELSPFVSNVWRAIQSDPLAVAHHSAYPKHEITYHARHDYLQKQVDFKQRMLEDPDYFDAKLAGWWLWGAGMSIGGGWYTPRVLRSIPILSPGGGQGVHSLSRRERLPEVFTELAERLRFVRIVCGDWKRVVKPSVIKWENHSTGVFLDPPYMTSSEIYNDQRTNVAVEVVEWCKRNWNDPTLRIVYCGYEGDLEIPKDWESISWEANGGWANVAKEHKNLNKHRERIFFNPACKHDYGQLNRITAKKCATTSRK